MSNITIGSIVRVKAPGKSYTTYGKKFEQLGFVNTKYNESFEKGTHAIVWGVTTHESDNSITMLAILDMYGNESLIGEQGVDEVREVALSICMNLTNQLNKKISELPTGLKVEGDLMLGSKITKLPDSREISQETMLVAVIDLEGKVTVQSVPVFDMRLKNQ